MIIPWNFKYSKIAELSEKTQQKFIKAYPKKYQKKIEKILGDFKKRCYTNNRKRGSNYV